MKKPSPKFKALIDHFKPLVSRFRDGMRLIAPPIVARPTPQPKKPMLLSVLTDGRRFATTCNSMLIRDLDPEGYDNGEPRVQAKTVTPMIPLIRLPLK